MVSNEPSSVSGSQLFFRIVLVAARLSHLMVIHSPCSFAYFWPFNSMSWRAWSSAFSWLTFEIYVASGTVYTTSAPFSNSGSQSFLVNVFDISTFSKNSFILFFWTNV